MSISYNSAYSAIIHTLSVPLTPQCPIAVSIFPFHTVSVCVCVFLLTFGVMLCVIQKARCCWMLSMLWQCCCRVVRRYFCSARAIDGKMACAASRGSITSPGDFFCSSSCTRRMCVNASSTATTSLEEENRGFVKVEPDATFVVR